MGVDLQLGDDVIKISFGALDINLSGGKNIARRRDGQERFKTQVRLMKMLDNCGSSLLHRQTKSKQEMFAISNF